MGYLQSQSRRINLAIFSLLILLCVTAAPDRQWAKAPAAQCPTITLNPASLPGAALGVAYSQTFTASGGLGPYTFTRTAGTLPPGLSLNSGGSLSGAPNATGAYNFTIQATGVNGCTGSRSYS
ncbi:MAG: Ig domain-containing protein, partial [Blastocatellia bacterium]